MILKVIRAQFRQSSLNVVSKSFLILLFIFIFLMINDDSNTVYKNDEDNWNLNSSSIIIKYSNFSKFFLDKNEYIDLSNFGINVNCFYLITLEQSQISIGSHNSTSSFYIENILIPITLNSNIHNIFLNNEINLSELDFLVFNESYNHEIDNWVISENGNISLNNLNADSKNVNESILNNIENLSENILSIENASSTLILLNSDLFDIETWNLIIENVKEIVRYDFWDLPNDYPLNLDNLYNFINNVEETAKNQIILKLKMDNSYDSNLNSYLISKILIFQSQMTLKVLVIYLPLICIFMINLKIFQSYIGIETIIFTKFIRNELIRGSPSISIFFVIFKYHLFHELISLLISFSIIAFVPNVSNINLIFLVIGSILILLFNFITNMFSSIEWLNSINTLEIEKNISNATSFFKKGLYPGFLFFCFVIFFLILFNPSNLTEMLFNIILLFILIFILLLTVKFPLILVSHYEKILKKLNHKFHVKTSILINFNVFTSKKLVRNWITLAILMMLFIPLLYSNNVEINDFSTYYSDLYTISDVYYEDIKKTERDLLSISPFISKSTSIQKIFYNGEFSQQKKDNSPVILIYIIDFKILKSLINLKSFNVLDSNLQNLLNKGINTLYNAIASSELSLLFESKNINKLNFLNSNFTLNIIEKYSYFPSIIENNWIILDKSSFNDEYNNFYNNFTRNEIDWIGQITDLNKFQLWKRDNLGYLKQRNQNINFFQSLPLKISLFRFLCDINNFITTLIVLTQFNLFLNFLRLTFLIYEQFKESIEMFLLRGSPFNRLVQYFYFYFLIFLLSFLLFVIPLLIINFIYDLNYFRLYRMEFPNIPILLPIELISFPIIINFIILSTFILISLNKTKKIINLQ
jgi:hypothetical protein